MTAKKEETSPKRGLEEGGDGKEEGRRKTTTTTTTRGDDGEEMAKSDVADTTMGCDDVQAQKRAKAPPSGVEGEGGKESATTTTTPKEVDADSTTTTTTTIKGGDAKEEAGGGGSSGGGGGVDGGSADADDRGGGGAEEKNAEEGEGKTVDLTGDGGVLKTIRREGTGERPTSGEDEVEVHYVGTLASDGSKFDSSVERGKPFRFHLGKGHVIKGWDIGVATMRVGEKALLTVAADYGYGSGGAGSSIPPNATLKFEVELLKTGPVPKQLWEMTNEEKLQAASDDKEKGNEAFKSGDYITAIGHYREALEKFENSEEWRDTVAEKARILQLSLHLNSANSYCRTQQWAQAIHSATTALHIDPKNSKALYRRAVARRSYGMANDAKTDLLEAAKLDPQNKEIRVEFERCKKQIVETRAKEKKTYGLLFKDNFYDEKPNIRSNRPSVFLTVKVGGDGEPKRMEVQLFDDTVPKTAENFRLLCTGEKGKGQKAASLHYKNTKFHFLSAGEFIQGGDIVNGDGTGGESVYGEAFENEMKQDQLNERGLLAMAMPGEDSTRSSSQFLISFKPLPHRTGRNVVFGRIVEGLEVLEELEKVECAEDGSPKTDVTIVDCGAIPLSQ